MILTDMADFYQRRFRSELTARRIKQTTEFGQSLAKSGLFRAQLYDHTASIFALLEQDSPTLLIHFDSLISLGSTTTNLARLYNWDEEYIARVQKLYKLQEYDAQNWFEPFNKYLEARHEYRNAAQYFKCILNRSVKPDQKFNLQRIKVATFPETLNIPQDDIKMMTISTEILNIPGKTL